MNKIDNIDILGFRCIMFNFIIGRNLEGFVPIRVGNFDFDVVFDEDVGMEVEKVNELIMRHMVKIVFNCS